MPEFTLTERMTMKQDSFSISLTTRSFVTTMAVVAWCAAAPAPSVAQPELDGCAVAADEFDEIVAPLLAGNWVMSNGAGMMTASMGGQSFAMPMPPSPEERGVISWHDDHAWIDTGDGKEAMIFLREDEEYPSITLNGVETHLDASALEGGTNCAIEDMLRLRFTTGYMFEGGEMAAAVDLYFINENLMSGVFSAEGSPEEGGQMQAKRLVTLRRAP